MTEHAGDRPSWTGSSWSKYVVADDRIHVHRRLVDNRAQWIVSWRGVGGVTLLSAYPGDYSGWRRALVFANALSR